MIRVVIIEDESLIAAELRKTIATVATDVQVVATVSSVAEGTRLFSSGPAVDLVLSDIQLTDGLSFTIFERLKFTLPVVFITGFDSFIMNAFEHSGIDYLLKPVDENDLVKVFAKYRNLERHFAQGQRLRQFLEKKKERLVVRRGFVNVLLKIEEIVVFYTENKIVYVIDNNGNKYVADQKLSELETLLDPELFFRANRQYIININFVKSYRSFEKVKLSVELGAEAHDHMVIVSQETAPEFRKWISER
ncbi:MAG TPA: LytTR family DNA-binding domain-containing protein [Chitinophagaceae bacterium]